MKEDYKKSDIDLFDEYKTNINGLSENEATERLKKYGLNQLEQRKKESKIKIFLRQFNDLMVILLIIAAILSIFVSLLQGDSIIDSVIIIVIVIVNAVLSFIQEIKSDMAIEELNKMFITNNYVLRNGEQKQIDVRNIVPGDIVILEAGDYVSADGRIITEEGLEINESTLTGESKAVKKCNEVFNTDKELYERSNMVFAGCNVTNGRAKVLITKTAMKTELGKIATSLIDKKNDITPLQKKINQISKILTYIVLGIIFVMMIIGLLMKNAFFDVLMLSISLAVAAIPEGLSSVITIILSLGMTSMAKKNVIIRKMASVETLGSTDIICSDKTGTITKNMMEIKSIYLNNKLYNENDVINQNNLLYECASLCQDVVRNNDGTFYGDETEVAIIKYLDKIGYKTSINERIKEYPFDSDRKMMSVIYKKDNDNVAYIKGSFDSIISRCSKYLLDDNVYELDETYKKQLADIERKESSKALRLIAFAYKDNNIDSPEENMIFIGLMGMMDPPRDKVRDAIILCEKSGIRPIMITGDSINTAIAVAKDVNIIDDSSKAIEGKYIDKMSDKEMDKYILNYQVFARISPNTKMRIVETLQKKGYVVAMTGDGVNDAPSIQKADIGIGMGITGTEVVKKVADCILVDDSFNTIVEGVSEGRRITSNIKKVVLYLLAGNIIEVILVFVSLLLNMEFFTTLQLLWINLVTDSIPAISLAFEKNMDGLMDNTPDNKYNQSFFTPFLNAKIIITAVIKSIIMILFTIALSKNVGIQTATSLLFIYLICNELLFAYSCRNPKKSILNKHIFENKTLNLSFISIIILQILLFVSPLGKYFIAGNINTKYILLTILITIVSFILEELFKPIFTKLFKDYR